MNAAPSMATARWWLGLVRKIIRAAFGLLILVGATLGVFSLFATGKEYPVTGVGGPPRALAGAYHVHSTASDGRADLPAIAQAAQRAGLSFVVMTDHNLETLPPPRYLSGVLVIQGVEESTPDGHLVAIGMPRGLSALERASDPIGVVASLGGTPILAHPVQTRNPWRDWIKGSSAAGLELYSADTMLREAFSSPAALICAIGSYLANPAHGLITLVQPQPIAAARLLELSSREGTQPLALCSHDAHGIPPYEAVFRAMAMYLPGERAKLPDDPIKASRQVLDALRGGTAYCAFHALGDAAGFSIEPTRNRQAKVGDRLRVVLPPTGQAQTRLAVTGVGRVDEEGRVVLERPGRVLIQVEMLAPGCFTDQVWRPWIVASPIAVVGAAESR